jgi:hypothetical protein
MSGNEEVWQDARARAAAPLVLLEELSGKKCSVIIERLDFTFQQ